MIRLLLTTLLLPATALAQPRSEIWLVNGTGHTIERLAVIPAGTRPAAPQEAIAEPMAPGQGVRILRGFPGCRLDVLVSFAGGGQAVERNLDVCRTGQVVLRGRPAESPASTSPPAGSMPAPAPPSIEPPSPWGFDFLQGPTRGIRPNRLEAPSPWGINPPGPGLLP